MLQKHTGGGEIERERQSLESCRALAALHACKIYTEHVCKCVIWVFPLAARLGPLAVKNDPTFS